MSQKQPIKTDKAAPPIGPYNQGVRWDRLVFTSSVGTSNPQFGDPADVKEAARNALENLKAILEEGGSGLAHLLKMTLYIRSMDDFAAINEVYAQYVPDPKPVRSLVVVQGARGPVSFDAIAYVPD